jgi:hypothetical protein
MIKHLIFIIRLKWAIKRAESLHNLTKRQYYVLQWKGKPKVFSSVQLRNLKKMRRIKISWLKVQEMALYKTK